MALSPALRGMVSQAKNKYKNSNGKTVKPKDGRNTFRILAPTNAQAEWVPASGQFWADVGVHWIKADKEGKPLVVLGDSEVVYGKQSVVNTAIAMAIDSAMDEESKKLYESWKSRRTVLVNALDRDQGDAEVILELTGTTWGKYLELIEIYADSDIDITDMATGIDIIITRSGKGLQTEYDITAAPGVSKPVTKEQMGKAEDLNEFIATNFFRGEEQKALNSIAQITGIAVPQIGGTAATTPTAALTSSAVSVEDAAPVVETPAQVDPQVAEAAKRRAELIAAQQEAAAELAALETPAPAADSTPAPVVEAETETGLGKSEEDALLAELASLTEG